MGERIRRKDWAATPLGPIASWPQSLKTVVRIMLDSRYAMWMAWGPELCFFYNDAYRPTLGVKHPWALGMPASSVWAEIWPDIGPRVEHVVKEGQATYDEDLRLLLERHGYAEETYHTFSYSPLPDDHGGRGGMLCVVVEDTQRFIADRRLRVLRDLAARSAGTRSLQDLFGAITSSLGGNQSDLPFTLLYARDPDGGQDRLVAATGIPARHSIAVPVIERGRETLLWSPSAIDPAAATTVLDVSRWPHEPLPAGAWDRPPRQVVVATIAPQGQSEPVAFLVAGLNPYRPLDDDYRGFLDLLASKLAAGFAAARASEEERKRAESLAALDRAKTAFFTNVSHELRTPLTLILGPTEELLARHGTLPAPDRERLEVVHRNSLRMMKLVNTLLDFSRIEAGRMQACYEPTDLAALTTDLAGVFRSAVENAGLTLTVDCPALPEAIHVDREMWEKIVLNFLSNALKFTFTGGIAVALRQRADHVELTVTDSGIGIAGDELPHVFERFHRVRGARARTHEGTGIGLALVKELVALHGGTVSVASMIDRGTTFTVRIPSGTSHLPRNRIGAARTQGCIPIDADGFANEAQRWLPAPDPEQPSLVPHGTIAPAAGGAAIGATERPRILLADDNADMREYLRRLLAERWDVQAVADGTSALEAARTRSPDLVLTDVMMPGLDGFELLHALRTDPGTSTVPVILLSARAGEESRVEGLGRGADDYLIKPFSARELMARVQAHLDLRQLRQRSEQALRDSELRFRNLADHAPVMIRVVDPSGCCTFLSKSWCEFTGRAPESGLGSGWCDAIHAEDRPAVEAALRAAIARREPFRLEYRLRRAQGDHGWVIDTAVPHLGEHGELLGFLGSVVDITDRKKAEEALHDADRRKDEFLATLAHELRNPLAPIRNAVHILEQVRDDAVAVERAREIVDRQLRHLVRLVDDLLDVSRITQGKLELHREPVDLASVVQIALETVRPLSESKHQEIAVERSDEPLWVDGDATRLAQVFANLIDNGVKYSDPRSRITIGLRRQHRHAVVTVADLGIGIPEPMLPRVFDTFFQLDRPGSSPREGLGIGLSLVKRLVELHGGSVEAHSDGPGMGSTFVVRLELIEASTGVHVPQPGPAATEAPPRPAAVRILVADDNRDSVESMAKLLSMSGYETCVAYDGIEALEAAERFRPQIVLLDLGMPRLDGYATAVRLRERPWARSITLLALTGWGQEQDKRRTREAGFDHHLVKPVDPDVLERLIVNGMREPDAVENRVQVPAPERSRTGCS